MSCSAATVSRMKSKLPACFFISSAFLEMTTSFAPSLSASFVLPGEVVKRTTSRADGRGELHAHVAEAAQADDADLLALADLPVTQRRVGGDARAEQRRGGGEIELVGNLEREGLVDDDGGRSSRRR